MVLFVMQWNIHPDKADAYVKWTEGAIRRTCAASGVVEFRAYRPASGPYQVVVTYEFADLAAWATWQASPDVQQVLNELHTLAFNVTQEIWGPSPVVPAPVRPRR
jgi:quinol monooxygenase YgiN